MTDKRKAELFDKAMGWIFGQLQYGKEWEYEDTLEEIGFTDKEIAEEMAEIFADEDENDIDNKTEQ